MSITAPTSPTLTPVNSVVIAFSEPVENFTMADLQLNLTVNGVTASEPLDGATLSTSNYQNWTLGNLAAFTSTSGTYTLTLTTAGWNVTDAYGNVLTTGASTTWTESNPVVQSISTVGSTITNASTVQYTVAFNESVTGVAASDFTLVTSGTSGTIASVSGSGATYTVTVKNVSGNGSLGLDLVDSNSIVDQYNNLLGGTAVGDGNFTGPLYTIDTTAPTITIGSPSAAYANASDTVAYTVTYADAYFGSSSLVAGDITLDPTGNASGTVSVAGSGQTYTVAISNITGNGSLGISIAAGTAIDLAGNTAPAAGPSATFTVDNTVVATAASATPATVTGTTTALSVLGADPSGEPSLTYSWAATTLLNGATPPTFLVNGSNAAKNTTAIFSTAGTYGFTVTITDTAGLTATSSVSVTVNQTLTSISLAGQPPVATAFDQFGNPLVNQPEIDAGTDTITGPLELDSNVTVLPVAGTPLTIAGGISGAGGLTIGGVPGTPGQGTVILSGANSYSGGTTVAAGTLIVSNTSAIAAGTNLTIGAGAALFLTSSVDATPSEVVATTTPTIASAEASASSSPARLSSVPAVDSSAMPLVQSPADVTPPPVTLPLFTLPQVVNNGPVGGSNSQSSMATPLMSQSPNVVRRTIAPGLMPYPQSVPITPSRTSAVNRFVGPSTAKRIGGDLAWLVQAANSSDSSDQQRKKDVAILALDAVFAEYGR